MSTPQADDSTPGAEPSERQVVAVEGLRLSVSSVARRLGVAPATLRTWDRRYGVGPTGHTPGSHRRYAPSDVLRLELMQHALAHGAAPAEAAHHALTTPTTAPAPTAPAPTAAAPRYPGATSSNGPAGAVDMVVVDMVVVDMVVVDMVVDNDAPAAGTRYRSPLPMRGAGRRAHGLARAVLALDGDTTTHLLSDSIKDVGIITTWDDVARPVLRALAERWSRTGGAIESEHLLTEAVTAVMASITVTTTPPVSARPILLGTLTGEFHALPLRVLAATLTERGVKTSLIGADLPLEALTAAITRTAPAAVFLWSHLEDPNGPQAVAQLPRTRPHTRCYVGGPGWNTTQLPPNIVALGSLREASTVLTAAAGL